MASSFTLSLWMYGSWNWSLFFNYSMPQPYTMLITTNHRSSLSLDDVTYTVLELCCFTNENNAVVFWFLLSNLSLLEPNVMNLISIAYCYHKTQIKYKLG